MTRSLRLSALAALCLVTACALPAAAQGLNDKVKFNNVKVGFPSGPISQDELGVGGSTPRFKAGSWTPVYIDLLCATQELNRAEVTVETSDSDDVANNYTVPVPALKLGESANLIAYTRPGSANADFTISVRDKDGKLCCPPYRQSFPGIESAQVLYLALGSRLPGLRLPGTAEQPNPQPQPQPGMPTNAPPSRAEAAAITGVSQMPNLWFGYAGADTVILVTSDRPFAQDLATERDGRKAALSEWVRRGGKLVVSVGRNVDQFAGDDAAELRAVLPMNLGKLFAVSQQRLDWPGASAGAVPEPLTGTAGKAIEFTRLEPKADRSAQVLVEGVDDKGAKVPLVAQAAYGLGRVTVVAFDLDQKPFAGWAGQDTFWRELLTRSGPRVPPVSTGPGNYIVGNRRFGDIEDEGVLQGIVNQLENFEGVPVISFGWVALFILLYIIVVGPLDYLFLKKVVKRLELTWITFPTIVLAVSAAAYFTAYALKGNDQRINKLDLVDVDLGTKAVYGRTWFTIFSPRIQNYTVGIEASAPDWAPPPAGPADEPLISWCGVPKPGRQSLFRRNYDYVPQAAGLVRVPIQVWSTKGFQAHWQAPLDTNTPLFTAKLDRTPDGRRLFGTVTSNLPVALEAAHLIYRGEVTRLETLLPGTPKDVTVQEPMKFETWLQTTNTSGVITQAGPDGRQVTVPGLNLSLMFHEAAQQLTNQNKLDNASLRDLDESWRVRDTNTAEVILVGLLPRATGLAEEVTRQPGSPSRLWLGDLPPSGRPRPTIQGTLRQDVLVRVFIPLPPAAGPAGAKP
jgi:hypothetical protein